MQKFGLWIQKQQKYPITRSLYNALLEKEPIDWTEAEIIACKLKKKFAFYYIKQLLDSNFGKNPQKSCALTPTSLIGPPPLGIPAAPALLVSPSPTPDLSTPAPFVSPSLTPGLLTPAPSNISIYTM